MRFHPSWGQPRLLRRGHSRTLAHAKSLHPLGQPGRACRHFGASGRVAEGGPEAEEAASDDPSTKGGFG